MNTATVAPLAFPALRRLTQVLAPVALTTALADLMFWSGHWGISIGLFFGGLGIIILTRHGRTRPSATTIITTALLALSVVQSAVQTSLSNAIACAGLMLALAGSVFHPQLKTMWPRVSEICFGLVTAPMRWFRVGATATESLVEARLPGFNIAAFITKAAWVFGPAVVLLLIFTVVFASGNSLFAEFLNTLADRTSNTWDFLDLTPARVFLWGLISTVALGLFHGTPAPDSPRWWTRTLPRIPRPDFNLAALQSGAVLVALNVLFFVVNTLDGLYLWKHNTLPVGIHRSELVHSGVNATMVAVILSAILIANIFQQDDRTADRRWLRWFSHFWVLQNMALIASSFLRLKFYTHDYMLTEKRIYAGCFLALVAVGFLLLLWFVGKRNSFNWLLGTNALATFALFFLLQFANVAAFVAEYNFGRWERDRTTLDISYMAALGPGAWPTLLRVAASSRDHVAQEARGHLEVLAAIEHDTDWRATQLRREHSLADIRTALGTKP